MLGGREGELDEGELGEGELGELEEGVRGGHDIIIEACRHIVDSTDPK